MIQADIRLLVAKSVLPANDYLKALLAIRDTEFWKSWGQTLLLALGVGHILAGFIYFFAFNWNDLSQAYKFGLVQAGFIVSVITWVAMRLDKYAVGFGIAATTFIGISLAVYGQVFQTPAMIYTHFTLWAMLSLPFALMSRSYAHWTVWIVIFYVAITSYIQFGIMPIRGEIAAYIGYFMAALGLMSILGIIDLVITKPDKTAPVWFRIVLVAIAQLLIFIVFNHAYWNDPPHYLVAIAALGISILITLYLSRIQPEPAALSASTFAVFLILATMSFKFLEYNGNFDFTFPLLVIFVWIVFLTILMAKLFRYYLSEFGPNKDRLDSPKKSKANPDSKLQAFAERFKIDAKAIKETFSAEQSTWYMEFILGLAGILAAIFALAFFGFLLGITFSGIDGNLFTVSFIIGSVLLILSGIARRKNSSPFLRHFFNSLIVAGYIMTLSSLSFLLVNDDVIPLLAIILAIGIIYWIDDPIIEFLMSAAIVCSIIWALMNWNVKHRLIILMAISAIAAMLFLTRPLGKRVYQAAGSAFLIVPSLIILISKAAVASKVFYVGYKSGLSDLNSVDHWISAAILLSGVIYLNWSLGRRKWQDIDPPLFVILPLTLCCVILPVGASMMLLAIFTGYILGEKSIAITGVLIEIAFLVWFYYDLSATLLVKSTILIFVGLVCLFLWYLALPDSRLRKITTRATSS